MRLQLDHGGSVRKRLSAAACMLLATGAPAVARGDNAATTQIEATGLLYGEQDRTNVIEPTFRATRLFSNGQSLSGQFALDAMTGASPTGAMPSGQVQTITSASGQTTTIPAGNFPTSPFHDLRGAVDLDWQVPAGITTSTLGGHFSREKDYQSLGVSTQFALDMFRRTTTLTLGAGANYDDVFPVVSDSSGGVAPFEGEGGDGGESGQHHGPTHSKRVGSALIGLTQVLSRRWMASVTGSRTLERGYLTEPYKVVSILDDNGEPIGSFPENRPDNRARNDVLAGTVYHLSRDVVYASYRYYWDDWAVRSHTYDLKYRHELGNLSFLQPHARYYVQSPADFFRYGVIHGPPPEFATSDGRLGPLHGVTVGATFGFTPGGSFPGEITIRGEYFRQWGENHPAEAIGVQRNLDLSQSVNIGSVLIGYTYEF
jgi:hypothetical protein